MTTPPTRKSILSLYNTLMRTSRSFSSYNFRNYFIRQTKDRFRVIQAESNPDKIKSLYSEAVADLTVMKRSAIVNQLYGGWTLAVEQTNPKVKAAEAEITRGDS